MLRSAAVPESVLTELALTVPDVLPSRVLRAAAVTLLSVMAMVELAMDMGKQKKSQLRYKKQWRKRRRI